MSAATAAAQVLPALLGAILGIFPGGYLLFAAIITITDGDSTKATLPGPWQLLALVLATVLTWPRSPVFRPASVAAAPCPRRCRPSSPDLPLTETLHRWPRS